MRVAVANDKCIVVGRRPHCHICIPDEYVSLQHFRIFRGIDHRSWNYVKMRDARTKGVRHTELLRMPRFETGYDNDKMCMVAVDKQLSSPEKLVQVYSRASRRRDGNALRHRELLGMPCVTGSCFWH